MAGGLSLGLGLSLTSDLGASGSSELPLITTTDTKFIDATGCSFPTYGTATTPSVLYVAATDTIWRVWQAWDGVSRRVYCQTYNVATEEFAGPFFVGTDPLTDDDHGVPSIEYTTGGYMQVYFGAHGASSMKSARTTTANDPRFWTANTDIAVNSTYPKPNMVGSTNWLFLRETVTPGTSGVNPLVYVPVTYASGVPTVGTKVTAIDFGVGSRVYAGNFVEHGGKLWFPVTFADGDDTYREDIYLFGFDPAAETIESWGGGTVVAKASFSISRATARSSFMVVDQQGAGTAGNVPSLAIDTNGNPHIVYTDGVDNSANYSCKHVWHNGTSWQTPDTVGSFGTNNELHRYDTLGAVPLPDGEIDIYWVTASAFAFNRGGDISKRRWAAGVLASATVVLEARTEQALDCIAVVRRAPTSGSAARMVCSEISQASATESGRLRSFLHSDDGFIRRPFQSETLTRCAAVAVATGASVTDDHKEAIDEFYSTMKGVGVFQKKDVYWRFKAATEAEAALNFVDPALYPIVKVGSPTWSANSHYAGDGSSTKLRTGFTPSLHATKATQNAQALCVHILNNVVHDSYFDIGALNTVNTLFNGRITSGGAARGSIGDATNNNYGTLSNSIGRWCLSRSLSNLITLFRDGSSVATSAQASTGLPNGELYLCGTTTGWSNRQVRGGDYGGVMTLAEHTAQRAAEFRYDFAA